MRAAQPQEAALRAALGDTCENLDEVPAAAAFGAMRAAADSA